MQPRDPASQPMTARSQATATPAVPPTRGGTRFRSAARLLAGAAALTAALAIAGCATPAPGADGVEGAAQRDLAAGIALYDQGDYVAAIRTLLTSDGIWQGSLQTRITAQKYVAFSHCLSNRPSPCKQSFRDLLRMKPDFELAAAEAGHPLWGTAFRQARREAATAGASAAAAGTLAQSAR